MACNRRSENPGTQVQVCTLRAVSSAPERRAWWPPGASMPGGPSAQPGPRRPARPASQAAARPRLGWAIPGPSGQGPLQDTGLARKGGGTARGRPPGGKNPSRPLSASVPDQATSPARHYGAASPVHLLRRRHLPAPGPRPRRQDRPVPDGSSAIARDFTIARPPATVSIPQERLSHVSVRAAAYRKGPEIEPPLP